MSKKTAHRLRIIRIINVKILNFYNSIITCSNKNFPIMGGNFFFCLVGNCVIFQHLYYKYMYLNGKHICSYFQFNLAIPISFLCVVAFLLTMPLYAAPKDTGMGLVCVLSGIPVYLICVKWKNKPKVFQDYVSK